MNSSTVLLIALLLAAIGAVWYLVRRYIRTTSSLDSGKGSAGELEAFIAAYRSGRVDPTSLQGVASPGGSTQSAAQPAPSPATSASAPGVVAAAASTPAAGAAVARALLRPEVKLAYLSLRTGLRDHHVFANFPLSDLAGGNMPGRADLVVCNPGFAIVAAIDVSVGPGASEPAKAERLRSAGIRYLRVNAKAMPRPDDLRALLYPE